MQDADKKGGCTSVVPDLVEADGLADLLVVVRIVLPGGELEEGFRDQKALAVPAPPHSLIQLEDGVAHVHAGVQTLCLRFPFVVVDRA